MLSQYMKPLKCMHFLFVHHPANGVPSQYISSDIEMAFDSNRTWKRYLLRCDTMRSFFRSHHNMK
jgi:hypothetical protein